MLRSPFHRFINVAATCFYFSSFLSSVNAAPNGEFYQITHVPENGSTKGINDLISFSVAESQRKSWEELISLEELPTSDITAEKIEGLNIDIRPPVLLLRFMPDLEFLEGDNLPVIEQAGKSLYIGFPTNLKISDSELWSKILSCLQNAKCPLSHLNAKGHTKVYTSWISSDQDTFALSINSRYCVSLVRLKKKGERRYLKVSLLDQQTDLDNSHEKEVVLENGQLLNLKKLPISLQRQSRQIKIFANTILAGLEKIDRVSRAESFLKTHPVINVNNKKDAQDRPQFIIDAPFEFVWQMMPHLLKKCYMTTTCARIKSEMSCEYLPPNETNSDLADRDGYHNLDLLPDTYLLQFFDLGEQTAVQWCSSKNGAVLEESDIIFEAALRDIFKNYKKNVLSSKEVIKMQKETKKN